MFPLIEYYLFAFIRDLLLSLVLIMILCPEVGNGMNVMFKFRLHP